MNKHRKFNYNMRQAIVNEKFPWEQLKCTNISQNEKKFTWND